jgi:tetratricopeptide (TPR) repeat protein
VEEPALEVQPEDEEPALDLSEPGELSGSFLEEEPPPVEVDVPVEEPEAASAAPQVVEEPPLAFAESDLGFEVEMEAEAEPGPVAPAVAQPPARGAPSEVQRVLEEVEQYMSLGFVDDARDALRDLSARHPDEPTIAEAVERLGLDLDVPPDTAFEEPVFAVEEEDSSDIEIPAEVEEPRPAPADEEDFLAGLGVETTAAVAPDLGLEVETPAAEEEFDVEADLEAAVAEAAAATASAPPVEPEVSFEEEAPEEQESPVFAPEPPEPEPASAIEELAAPAPTSAWDGGGFDLGAELGDLFGAQAAVEEEPVAATSAELGDSGLADIFKEFKKGVDKQLGQEDYDTRYNLGIAYKEMGLIDEANRLLECSSMLGICFMEKGMPKLAIKWFEKGLKAPGRRDEEYQGLRYDLATAHEAAGDLDAALGLFTELYGQDANFRDVAAKLRELRGAQA